MGESVGGIVVIVEMVVVSFRVCIKKDRELHEKLDQKNSKYDYMSFQIFPLWISLFTRNKSEFFKRVLSFFTLFLYISTLVGLLVTVVVRLLVIFKVIL